MNQPRRRVMQTGAAIALLGVVDCWPVLAEPGEREAESQESGQAASKPKASLADTESWYRVRGEGFAMSVPPNYEDIVEYDVSTLHHIFGFVAVVFNLSTSVLLR